MICAIVLAAGKSERMGSQKVLLPIGDSSVVATIVSHLARSGVDRTLVVVGHDAARVESVLRDLPVLVVVNTEYETGMLSSVRAGLSALPDECEAVLVALGDQPRISAENVDRLMEAFVSQEKGIVVPVHGGKRGHPLLFSMRYRSEILERYDDVGLRGLLSAHPEDVFELEVGDASILEDMDTPRDYEREADAFEERGADGFSARER